MVNHSRIINMNTSYDECRVVRITTIRTCLNSCSSTENATNVLYHTMPVCSEPSSALWRSQTSLVDFASRLRYKNLLIYFSVQKSIDDIDVVSYVAGLNNLGEQRSTRGERRGQRFVVTCSQSLEESIDYTMGFVQRTIVVHHEDPCVCD